MSLEMVEAALISPSALRIGEIVRDVQDASVLGLPSGFEMMEFLATPQPVENVIHFCRTVRRQQQRNILPDYFFSAVTVHAFGGLVPGQYRSVEGLTENCIIRVFD